MRNTSTLFPHGLILLAVLGLTLAPARAFDEAVHEALAADQARRLFVPALVATPTAEASDDPPVSAEDVLVDWGRRVACTVAELPWRFSDHDSLALAALGWHVAMPGRPWRVPEAVGHPVDAWILGASAPDRDGRNQDRFLTGLDGQSRPADPLIGQFGGTRGLVSQAHAHYALPPGSRAGLLAWLRDPAAAGWDLVGLGELPSEARAQAEIHWQAALRVRQVDPFAAAWLLGGGLHYLHDAADPLHNVQAGPRRLLANAALGAVLGRQGLTDAGVRILRNLHLGAEALQAAWFFGDGPEAGRDRFAAARDAARESAVFPDVSPALWVDMLATAGARDGLTTYVRMARVATPELARGVTDISDSLDPEHGWRAVLRPEAPVENLEVLAEVLGRSIGRAEAVTTALLRRWQRGDVPSDTLVRQRWRAQLERVDRLAPDLPWARPAPCE